MARRPMQVIRIVCICLVANSLLGAAFAQVAPSRSADLAVIRLNPADVPGKGPTSNPIDDPRVDSPAMQAYPWRKDYFGEYTSVGNRYEPYVTIKELDKVGKYVNIEGGVRLSWEPPATSGRRNPVVWFFGGSTLYGEDQRDLFTIPSMVARRAAAEGHPITVVNAGVQGYTNYQEVLTFEQMLADRPAPDAVVFYDGVNDLAVQRQFPSEQPTIYTAAIPLGGRPTRYEQWARTSLVTQLWRRFPLLATLPAGAAERPPTVQQIARRTVAIYDRGIDMARILAKRHGVELLAFWQPSLTTSTDRASQLALKLLPKGVIDVSHALDGIPTEQIYIDGVHHNERAARIVADHLWPFVERTVT